MNPITLTTIKLKRVATKRRIINFSLICLLALIIVGGYFLGQRIPKINLAQLIRTQRETKVTQASKEAKEILKEQGLEIISLQTKVYEEEAQPGEGITHLARRALKKYLSEKGQGLNLTKEHKIYIEDYIQKKTGDYWLNVGQKLFFSEELIKEAIDRALKLTTEQLQNLTQYVELVSGLD